MGKKRKHTMGPASAAAAAVAAAVATQPGGSIGSGLVSNGARQAKKPRKPSHQHTDVAPTGVGQQLSAAPGRLAKEPLPSLSSSQPAAKWAPPAAAPSSCPHNPAAAVDLELARSVALEQLRHRLASLAAKAGLRNVPLLAFERWRFAAKWAEDEPQLAAAAAALTGQASAGNVPERQEQQQQQQQDQKLKQKQKQPPNDPVIPFGSLTVAPEPGLVTDLIRAGIDAAAAVEVATQLATSAAAAAAALVKKRQQLASGKAVGCGAVQVEFHKHSIDLTCGCTFVKISRPAYGKLAHLYRQHWIARVSSAGSTDSTAAAAAAGRGVLPACTVGLPMAEAAPYLATLRGSCPAAGSPAKRRKTSAAAAAAAAQSGDCSAENDSNSDHDTADADSDTEQESGQWLDGAAAGAADAKALTGGPNSRSGSSIGGLRAKQQLDAEASIAEIEQQQQQGQQDKDASCASSGGSSVQISVARADFHARLFALLLRYKSIQGHGFQAAAGPSVFDLLRSKLSIGYECFASPLNTHFSRFGSAFPDVDAPFGSGGSFFRMNLKHGSYEVNPPFVPSILTAAAQHMLQLLQTAEAFGGALGFVVLMPGWKEVAGWQMLNSSSFNRQSLLLAAADHGYCDGASHQRKDLYRQSPYDSSIMFLQTTAAAKKWPVRQQLLTDLQVAFAACCPSAAAAERQRKQRGVKDLEAKGYGVPVQKVAAAAASAAAGKKGKRAAADGS